jgi:hypothetical protein
MLACFKQSSFIGSSNQLTTSAAIVVLEQKECLQVTWAVCAVATLFSALPAHDGYCAHRQLVIPCEPREQAPPLLLELAKIVEQF